MIGRLLPQLLIVIRCDKLVNRAKVTPQRGTLALRLVVSLQPLDLSADKGQGMALLSFSCPLAHNSANGPCAIGGVEIYRIFPGHFLEIHWKMISPIGTGNTLGLFWAYKGW